MLRSLGPAASDAGAQPLPPALARYLEVVRRFAREGQACVYPGSPFITHHLLRDDDKPALHELHPTDARTLDANIAQLDAGRQIAVLREDGFGSATRSRPPPSRRALVLVDPSYELKTDYARTAFFIGEAVKAATGVYAVVTIIPRPEAHDLPRRLKTLANKAGALAARDAHGQVEQAHDQRGGRDPTAGPARQRHVSDQPALHPGRPVAPAPARLAEALAQDRYAAAAVGDGRLTHTAAEPLPLADLFSHAPRCCIAGL